MPSTPSIVPDLTADCSPGDRAARSGPIWKEEKNQKKAWAHRDMGSDLLTVANHCLPTLRKSGLGKVSKVEPQACTPCEPAARHSYVRGERHTQLIHVELLCQPLGGLLS